MVSAMEKMKNKAGKGGQEFQDRKEVDYNFK